MDDNSFSLKNNIYPNRNINTYENLRNTESYNSSFKNFSNNYEFSSSFVSETPIKLIEFEGKNFKVNPIAIDFLKEINEDLVIVSIVGKARTGKSYLLNLLLDLIGKGKGVRLFTLKTS